jgi:hypothetical protein
MPIVTGLMENPWVLNSRPTIESTQVSQVRINAERRIDSILEGLFQDGQNGEQFFRHVAFFRGQAIFEVWQYRPLTQILIEGLGRSFIYFGVPSPFLSTIFLLRFVVAFLSLYLLARYLSFFSQNSGLQALLLCCYTYASISSNFWSDLSLSTHLEVCFYLLAGIYAFQPFGRGRLLLMAFLAATNRESAILLPLIIFFSGDKAAKMNAFISLLVIVATYALLRVLIFRDVLGTFQTTDLGAFLPYNLFEFYPLVNFLKVLLLLPVVLLTGLHFIKSDFLRRVLFVFCPIWILAHFLCANVAEARLFLVPLAIAVLPVFALGVKLGQSEQE